MGFLLGSVVLIGIYTLVQPGTAGKAGAAGDVAVGLLRRVLSPEVAGVPQKAPANASTPVGPAAQSALDAVRQYTLQHPPPGSPSPIITPAPQGRIR